MYGRSVNAAPCVSVILTMREMSVNLTQIDLLSVNLTHSRSRLVHILEYVPDTGHKAPYARCQGLRKRSNY